MTLCSVLGITIALPRQTSQGNKLRDRLAKKRKDRENQLALENANAEATKVLTLRSPFALRAPCIFRSGLVCFLLLFSAFRSITTVELYIVSKVARYNRSINATIHTLCHIAGGETEDGSGRKEGDSAAG